MPSSQPPDGSDSLRPTKRRKTRASPKHQRRSLELKSRKTWCPVHQVEHKSPRQVRRHLEGRGIPHYFSVYGTSKRGAEGDGEAGEVEEPSDNSRGLASNQAGLLPPTRSGNLLDQFTADDTPLNDAGASTGTLPQLAENTSASPRADRLSPTGSNELPSGGTSHSAPFSSGRGVSVVLHDHSHETRGSLMAGEQYNQSGDINSLNFDVDDLTSSRGSSDTSGFADGQPVDATLPSEAQSPFPPDSAPAHDVSDFHHVAYPTVWGSHYNEAHAVRHRARSYSSSSRSESEVSHSSDEANNSGMDDHLVASSEDSGGLYDCEISGLVALQIEDLLNSGFRMDAVHNAQQLMESQMNDIRGFNLKVDTAMKDSVYAKIFRAFPSLPPAASIYHLRRSVTHLSGIQSQAYDCCINCCMCYTGPNEDLDSCLFCKEPRYNEKGEARKKYHYIPLTPRLQTMYRNTDLSLILQSYRANYIAKPDGYSDIFDGELYQTLCNTAITDHEQGLQYYHFSNPHDIALGISFDGFCPFKRRKQTCWPIIAINYNLPPTDRFKLVNLISIALIPGPRQPKDTDSFLLPFVEEMLSLTRGVKTFDGHLGEYFVLRAFCMAGFGDIPAVAKLMRMKGHNALYPCRCCNIHGIRNSSSSSTIHYVPLSRPGNNQSYDPLSLPLRMHQEFMDQAMEVADAETSAQAERLAKATGIKGVPILSYLKTLRFPDSFPPDLMHAIFENLIPELLDLWTNDYKGIDDGREEYCLERSPLAAINEGILLSGQTLPSTLGCRTPSFLTERHQYTAEAWSMWALVLGPVLLRGRFKQHKYFKHFVQLVVNINACMALEISDEHVDILEKGMAEWVLQFEKLYFQDNLDRLPVCTLPLHYLLHFAESIRRCGPLWNFWAFAMERYCGSLLPAVHSRKHPFRSLDRRILELAQLSQIKLIYGLEQVLDLRAARTVEDSGERVPPYTTVVFTFPMQILPFTLTLRRKIANKLQAFIAQDYQDLAEDDLPTTQQLLADIPQAMTCWGKMKIIGGNMIHASDLVSAGEHGRDMSYVKFDSDHGDTLYGKLDRVFKVEVTIPNIQRHYVFAVIRPCKITIREGQVWQQQYTKGDFYAEVVTEVTSVQGLAARVLDPQRSHGHTREEVFVNPPGAITFVDPDRMYVDHDIENSGHM